MRYTSELTDSQWEIIKPILQEARYRSIEKKREHLCACPCGQYSRYQGQSIYFWKSLLYRYPTIVGVRADQRDRGTFKNTFEIYHDIKVDISPRIKNEFEIQPVRWVVERTFGWMTWSRRLSKDYEIKTFYQEDICIISNL